jgi:hypothetical protein
MEPSIAGLIVAALLLLLGRVMGAAIVVGLFAAVPMQSTAFATLPALGGSSPQVVTLFAIFLVFACVLRRDSGRDLKAVFADHWAPWVICGLTLYVIIGAYLMPRIFLGQAGAFVVVRDNVFEVPLSPVSGNVTQTGYFVLDAAAFVCLMIMLRRLSAWQNVLAGMFALVAIHAAAALIQVGGNLAGLSDVLLPIRTANYAMLADHQIGALWRIAGACSETSAFSSLATACLAFSVVYWRRTGSTAALLLGLLHLALLILSTSTTAYVGLGFLGVVLAGSLLANVLRGRAKPRDLVLIAMAGVGLVALLAGMLFWPVVVDTFADLLDNMVFKKHLSSSGQERGYWNSQSMRAFFETYGLGIGMGSSRASSWAVAVLSQIGIIGALGFAVLLVAVWRAPAMVPLSVRLPNGAALADLAYGMRATVMASLFTLSLSGTNVDPGLLVFAGMAVCISAPLIGRRIAAAGGNGFPVRRGVRARATMGSSTGAVPA